MNHSLTSYLRLLKSTLERYKPNIWEGDGTVGSPNLIVPEERIREFCKRNKIRRLSFFGSVLREDFTPESDVDVLVEFEPHARVGLIRLAGLELELGEILGRKVDLNTEGFLSQDYRERVLSEAVVQYDAA
ncbi:MAG: nucleotidyltransferase [Desulfobacteraceae bacterium]|nr:MAG: nucleotidyltransferase [Desulfobacteraceae bacterium]